MLSIELFFSGLRVGDNVSHRLLALGNLRVHKQPIDLLC